MFNYILNILIIVLHVAWVYVIAFWNSYQVKGMEFIKY